MSGSTTKVRIAVLGTGNIVREFHLAALRQTAGAEIVALGNLRRPSLEELGHEYGIARLYTDMERLAEDPGIDAVLNALPNYLHAPVTIQMLRHGKHVLCEKPMARTIAEAESMVEAAESAQRQLWLAYAWRSDHEVNWLRRVVQAGVLGSIIRIQAHSVVAGSGPSPDSWMRNPELSGGGALLDVGIHATNTISFLHDDALEPRRVLARCSSRFGPGPVEDTATVLVEYANGLTTVLDAGWNHGVAINSHGTLELFGERGYARIFPAKLILKQQSVPPELGCPPERTGGHIGPAMYETQFQRFVECVRNGGKPACDGRQGIRDLRLIHAAYQSAASGECVQLRESG